MLIRSLFWLLYFSPPIVYLCRHELNTSSGTITLPAYANNIECTWLWNLSFLAASPTPFRALLLTFLHFETEFGHDELWIGETIDDVSRYNSKFTRFSGWKLPDPYLIPLRGDLLTRSIWMQFTSDESKTASGFVLDYIFLVNQCKNHFSSRRSDSVAGEIRFRRKRSLNFLSRWKDRIPIDCT